MMSCYMQICDVGTPALAFFTLPEKKKKVTLDPGAVHLRNRPVGSPGEPRSDLVRTLYRSC